MGGSAVDNNSKIGLITTCTYRAAGVFAALALAACVMLAPTAVAYADGELISSNVVAPGSQIEELTHEYEEAFDAVDETGHRARIARSQMKKLDERLAQETQRANEAARQLYKLQDNGYKFVELLFASGSLDSFMKMSEYLEVITQRNLDVLSESMKERAQLEVKKGVLEDREKDVKERLAEAEQALREAQGSRAARQSEGIANGLAQDPSASWIDDGADWYATKEQFVEEWAPRIDDYLVGSPMAGLGTAFAEASWRYCVDPRWSPAIANIESSKGLICARPFNAWGWGAADEDPVGMALEWGSWEAAIDTHVSGLSAGYGYTISLSNAKKYCTDWENWYNVTVHQMALI